MGIFAQIFLLLIGMINMYLFTYNDGDDCDPTGPLLPGGVST